MVSSEGACAAYFKYRREENELSVSHPCYDRRITLAHGGGGRLSKTLIEKMFLPLLGQNKPEDLTMARFSR